MERILQSCPCHPMKLKDFKYMTNPDVQGRLKLQKMIFVWVKNTRFYWAQDGHALMSLCFWAKINECNKI